MRTLLSLLAVTLLLTALSDPALARKRTKKVPPKEQGIALLADMEDKEAITAFREALSVSKTDSEKASIYIYMGIAHFNLLEKDSARQSFQQALLLDAKSALPEIVSPKIQEVFDGVKGEMKAALKPKPKPKPKRKPKPKPKKSGQGAYRISAFVTLGLAVAAAAAGAGLAASGSGLEDDADDRSLSWAEAEDLHDQASSRYLGANILFGVAGAAAVTSAVMFYFGYRDMPEARVSLLPLRGGAIIQVGGVRW